MRSSPRRMYKSSSLLTDKLKWNAVDAETSTRNVARIRGHSPGGSQKRKMPRSGRDARLRDERERSKRTKWRFIRMLRFIRFMVVRNSRVVSFESRSRAGRVYADEGAKWSQNDALLNIESSRADNDSELQTRASAKQHVRSHTSVAEHWAKFACVETLPTKRTIHEYIHTYIHTAYTPTACPNMASDTRFRSAPLFRRAIFKFYSFRYAF